MCVSLCVPVFATEVETLRDAVPSVNLEEEIARAYNGISDIPVTANMKTAASAQAYSENGVVPVETHYTVRDLGTTAEGQVYALTAVSKTVTDSVSPSAQYPDINVRVAATLYWTDRGGDSSSVDRITGSWSCYDGCSVDTRKVISMARPFNTDPAHTQSRTDYPSTNSFDIYTALYGFWVSGTVSAIARCPDAKHYVSLLLDLSPSWIN